MGGKETKAGVERRLSVRQGSRLHISVRQREREREGERDGMGEGAREIEREL